MARGADKEGERALRLHQSVARQIGTAILSGRHAPGDVFPGEIEQSAAMGVSRTAYREAIRILIAKGLLESRPKAGTRVLPRERWNVLDPEMLAWMFMGTPDPVLIRDLFELRGLLEPAAARLAAERRSAEQLAQMGEAVEGMRRHGLSTEEGQAADRTFHRLVLEACGNRAMSSLASSVGAAVQWTTHYKQRAPHPRDPLPEHEAVLRAIAAADSEAAARTMSDLIRNAYEDMAAAGI